MPQLFALRHYYLLWEILIIDFLCIIHLSLYRYVPICLYVHSYMYVCILWSYYRRTVNNSVPCTIASLSRTFAYPLPHRVHPGRCHGGVGMLPCTACCMPGFWRSYLRYTDPRTAVIHTLRMFILYMLVRLHALPELAY